MSDAVLNNIRRFLDDAGISYRQVHHEPTRTSEESAQVRGEPLEVGGKAIVLKTDDQFRLFVLSAALKFDSGAIKKHFKLKKSRFASAEELLETTGLVPGCIPPFGEPILPLELFVDESIVQNQRIAFNAGSLTDSIIMSTQDYVEIAKPTVFSFSK
jgi:Ala-tRNA(Pro) deacylase